MKTYYAISSDTAEIVFIRCDTGFEAICEC